MAETLQVWMARKGWKPSELARQAQLSYALINKAMNGQKISKDSADKISKALNVNLSDISGLNY